MIALGSLLPVGMVLGVLQIHIPAHATVADGDNRGGMSLATRPVVNADGRTSDGNTVPPFVGSCSNDDNRGGMSLATRPVVDAGGRTSDGNTVPQFVGSSPLVHTFTSVDGRGSNSQTLVLTIPDVLRSGTQ